MIKINSPSSHSNSNKRLRFPIPRNRNNNLLINSTSKKFDNRKIHNHQQEKNSIDCNKTMKQEIIVANNNENDTTLLTTTTTVEFKVRTTKTSSRKRKSNVINDINNDNITKQQPLSKKKKNQRMIKNSDELFDNMIKKPMNKTVDQSSTTDESSFGSCEPGTNVVLQGIVWNETDKGVLVVNITWRGKTYVGALLSTSEQSWAPPRYKSDIRSTKSTHNRDYQLTSTPTSHESTERILRNGKRRGSTTTVTPNLSVKTNSFKIPEAPPIKIDDKPKVMEKFIDSSSTNIHDDDELSSITEEKSPIQNTNGDDEIIDNYSNRSVSPTTSSTTSTASSSPLLSNNIENQSSSIPIDLSNSKMTMNIEQNTSNSITERSIKSKTEDTLIPCHLTNEMLFSSSDYFSSLQNSANSFHLSSFNKLSSTSSAMPPSSYHSISSQIYLNSLKTSHYPSVSSLSNSSH